MDAALNHLRATGAALAQDRLCDQTFFPTLALLHPSFYGPVGYLVALKEKYVADIRDKAREILAVVPETGQITSNGGTAAKFTSLTGTSHETMKKNWEGGGIMTACNGFVGWYARTLREAVEGTKAPTNYLGRFDLETYLPSIGMGQAWVKSTADGRPKYGDICRHTAFHVGVSLDFAGDFWNHVDAGQGGQKMGCDILKRTRSDKAYDFTKLQGWIDIEVYYGSSPQTGRTPDWLVGWWKVVDGGDTYFYYFDQNGGVVWVENKPSKGGAPIGNFGNRGRSKLTGDDALEITWNWVAGGQTIENFTVTDVPRTHMNGSSNRWGPLVADRIK
jgi:hypothetical protein